MNRLPDPAAAGALIISSILACAAVGFGLGALVGAPLPLAIAGVFVGFAAGIALVVRRFRDL